MQQRGGAAANCWRPALLAARRCVHDACAATPRVPLHRPACSRSIDGDPEDGVNAASPRATAGGSVSDQVRCRRTGLSPAPGDPAGGSGGLPPSVFDENSRQWLPQVDDDGRSSIKASIWRATAHACAAPTARSARAVSRRCPRLQDLGLPVNGVRVDQLLQNSAEDGTLPRACVQAFPWPVQQMPRRCRTKRSCAAANAITAGELRRVVRDRRARGQPREGVFARRHGPLPGTLLRPRRRRDHRAHGRMCAAVEQVGRLRGQAPVKPLSIQTRRVSDEVSMSATTQPRSRCDHRRRHHGNDATAFFLRRRNRSVIRARTLDSWASRRAA
jgi:hypothetical protein